MTLQDDMLLNDKSTKMANSQKASIKYTYPNAWWEEGKWDLI